MTRSSSVLAVTLMLVMGVTACSAVPSHAPASPQQTDTPTPGPAATSSAGNVSEKAYKAAFDVFKECTRKSGVDLIVTGTDNAVIQYVFAAEDADRVDRCYSSDFRSIDVRWQQQRLSG